MSINVALLLLGLLSSLVAQNIGPVNTGKAFDTDDAFKKLTAARCLVITATMPSFDSDTFRMVRGFFVKDPSKSFLSVYSATHFYAGYSKKLHVVSLAQNKVLQSLDFPVPITVVVKGEKYLVAIGYGTEPNPLVPADVTLDFLKTIYVTTIQTYTIQSDGTLVFKDIIKVSGLIMGATMMGDTVTLATKESCSNIITPWWKLGGNQFTVTFDKVYFYQDQIPQWTTMVNVVSINVETKDLTFLSNFVSVFVEAIITDKSIYLWHTSEESTATKDYIPLFRAPNNKIKTKLKRFIVSNGPVTKGGDIGLPGRNENIDGFLESETSLLIINYEQSLDSTYFPTTNVWRLNLDLTLSASVRGILPGFYPKKVQYNGLKLYVKYIGRPFYLVIDSTPTVPLVNGELIDEITYAAYIGQLMSNVSMILDSTIEGRPIAYALQVDDIETPVELVRREITSINGGYPPQWTYKSLRIIGYANQAANVVSYVSGNSDKSVGLTVLKLRRGANEMNEILNLGFIEHSGGINYNNAFVIDVKYLDLVNMLSWSTCRVILLQTQPWLVKVNVKLPDCS